MINALLFDMDGVIIESEMPKFLFLKKVLNDFGVQFGNEQFQKIVGRSVRTFLEEYLHNEELEEKVWQIFQKDYLEKITKYISPIQPIVEFIKEYNGPVRLGIVSSGIQKINEGIAKYFGIYDILSVIVSREAVSKLKPVPDLYLKAAELLSINPKDCAVIEDTVVGVNSTLDAKMKCFVFLNNHNSKKDFSGLGVSGFVINKQDIRDILTTTKIKT